MHKKSLALSIMGMFMGQSIAPAVQAAANSHNLQQDFYKGGKGQVRQAKPKQSGAASLKRIAKKAKNISKRKK